MLTCLLRGRGLFADVEQSRVHLAIYVSGKLETTETSLVLAAVR